jgi:HK97 family phage portal protein
MKLWKELFGDQSPKPVEQKSQFQDVLSRLVAAQEGLLGGGINPESCMASPTVHAIVTAISNRMAVTPVHVYKRGMSDGKETKEKLPDHPVSKLLRQPNKWQTRHDFWADASSTFVRYGRFYAYKGRGKTGPIRELLPIPPTEVEPQQDENYNVTFKLANGDERQLSQFFHARSAARDFLKGDSPVDDVSQAIALEILAEKFGATFFHNGALPLLVFSFLEGSAGFRDEAQEKEFIRDFQAAFSGDKAHRALLLPKGLDAPSPIQIEHDKAQFLETRKYQRTVIAGAFGVPPTFVGDLERATFNNVEQMDQDFTTNVVMPVAQAFEAAMERDLLTDKDRREGIAIRFNLDSILRADFKSRQEGLKMQREMGVINANEWREIEGKNPREGGDEYWDEGPSGQNMGTGNESETDDTPSD